MWKYLDSKIWKSPVFKFLETIQRIALQEGLILRRTEKPENIRNLIAKLRPRDSGHELIRVGGDGDGGYLVPLDLSEIDCCFSPGVSNSARFEEDLKSKFDIASHLADFSVTEPPNGFEPKSFTPKFIGAYSNERFLSFDDWIDCYISTNHTRDQIMQIDIEGGEYEAILGLSDKKLNSFRVIVIEIHNTNHWADPTFFRIVDNFFEKILGNFSVIHFHPNNYGKIINIAGIKFPQVFELTLLRNDRMKGEFSWSQIPHPLDQKNCSDMPDIFVKFSD